MERTECKDVGMKGRIYKLWFSGKGYRVGGLGAMVKEDLCEKVVEAKIASDRVMTIVVLEVNLNMC